VEFRFDDEAEVALRRLQGIDTVDDVIHGRVPGSWIATLDIGTLPETVNRLIADGSRLVGVRRVDEDLDAIYRRYFEGEEVPV
jgi:hypothetical protein